MNIKIKTESLNFLIRDQITDRGIKVEIENKFSDLMKKLGYI